MTLLVLITGATAGIGLTLARQHARYGHDLILVARRKRNLEALKTELEESHGIVAHIFPSNLSSPGAAERVYKDVKDASLRVNLLINNADFCNHDTTTSRREIEDPTAVLGATVFTLRSLTRLFGEEMSNSGGGTIMNIGSAAAILDNPTSGAIEGFVRQFSKTVDKDLRSKGVQSRIKRHFFRDSQGLSKFSPCEKAEEKTIGNLKLRPSKHKSNPSVIFPRDVDFRFRKEEKSMGNLKLRVSKHTSS